MASKKKTTPELSALPRSHQAGSQRYLGTQEDQKPRSAPWRNNLTALSQRHNLYFVAYGDRIHVARPTFPEQKVPVRPALILCYGQFALRGGGYIDPMRPYAANHIIVGDLGEDEVLLIACDNGSVIGFRTDSIARVFGEHREQGVSSPNKQWGDMRPFFVQTVGASAWGLALQKDARMIAVSSNTQKILVFAFALDSELPILTEDSTNMASPAYRQFDDGLLEFGGPFKSFELGNVLRSVDYKWHDSPWTIDRRDHHVVIGLVGHETNIPNISFWNPDSASDKARLRTVVHLASTDVAGNVSVWDVWAAKRVFHVTAKQLDITGERGWSVTCLDPQFSYPTVNMEDAHGTKQVTRHDDATILNNTTCGAWIEDNCEFHPAFSRFPTVPSSLNQEDLQDFQVLIGAALNTGDVAADNAHIENPYNDEGDEDEEVADEGGNDEGDGEDDEGENEEIEVENEEVEDEDFSETDHAMAQQIIDIIVSQATAGPDTALNEEYGRIGSSDAANIESSSQSETPRQLKRLPFNLLFTSEVDVCLIQDMNNTLLGSKSESRAPFRGVLCSNVLKQQLPPIVPQLRHYERMNMSHQIPELGVVVVGNQIGRVALLTMTKWRLTDKDHQEDPAFEGVEEHAAFKIVAILPFMSQEQKNLRPERPLLGMAISPIQGQEGMNSSGIVGGSRRYRLIMTYYDHTVLSYEISRGVSGGELLIF